MEVTHRLLCKCMGSVPTPAHVCTVQCLSFGCTKVQVKVEEGEAGLSRRGARGYQSLFLVKLQVGFEPETFGKCILHIKRPCAIFLEHLY